MGGGEAGKGEGVARGQRRGQMDMGKEDLSLGVGKLSQGEMGELLILKVRERSGMC